MSPQHAGPTRHGSPQPGMMQGMRPPMPDPRGRFIRPTGAPGKEMRPRMPMQGQRQPNFGPRQMMIRQGQPGQPYNPGPMGSPAHQAQYGGMSPQHAAGMQPMHQTRHPNAGGMSPQHVQQPQQQQQMRPPSAGGSVPSPATDRPVTPQTPRTPGPPTPGHISQPPTPGQDQQFAQPSPQHIPHHMQQQQQQFMQPQQHQMQMQQPHPQQGGGGGNPGGPIPFMHDDFVRPRRGGWGPFVGLKGGRPMNNPQQVIFTLVQFCTLGGVLTRIFRL